jgi:DNA-binding NarL/FixJ family response regulator
MSKIRLLLVEDHTVVRAGLRALFDRQSDMEVVAEAGTSAEGLVRSQASRPDLVVLDLTLPGGGGLDLIAGLLRQKPAPHVLVLSMHDDPAYVRAALAAGAAGYLVKTVREQDLLAAVRAVRHGQVFIDLEDETRTASVFGQAARAGVQGGALAVRRLSEREREVLRLLGQGHSNVAIAERLDLSPKTVATYRARIADKLGLKTTVDYVKYAADTGLPGPLDPPS